MEGHGRCGTFAAVGPTAGLGVAGLVRKEYLELVVLATVNAAVDVALVALPTPMRCSPAPSKCC